MRARGSASRSRRPAREVRTLHAIAFCEVRGRRPAVEHVGPHLEPVLGKRGGLAVDQPRHVRRRPRHPPVVAHDRARAVVFAELGALRHHLLPVVVERHAVGVRDPSVVELGFLSVDRRNDLRVHRLARVARPGAVPPSGVIARFVGARERAVSGLLQAEVPQAVHVLYGEEVLPHPLSVGVGRSREFLVVVVIEFERDALLHRSLRHGAVRERSFAPLPPHLVAVRERGARGRDEAPVVRGPVVLRPRFAIFRREVIEAASSVRHVQGHRVHPPVDHSQPVEGLEDYVGLARAALDRVAPDGGRLDRLVRQDVRPDLARLVQALVPRQLQVRHVVAREGPIPDGSKGVGQRDALEPGVLEGGRADREDSSAVEREEAEGGVVGAGERAEVGVHERPVPDVDAERRHPAGRLGDVDEGEGRAALERGVTYRQGDATLAPEDAVANMNRAQRGASLESRCAYRDTVRFRVG